MLPLNPCKTWQLVFVATYASEAQGQALDPAVAGDLKFLIATKLLRKSMLDKSETPTNCPNLRVSKVNAAIWDSLQQKKNQKTNKIPKNK